MPRRKDLKRVFGGKKKQTEEAVLVKNSSNEDAALDKNSDQNTNPKLQTNLAPENLAPEKSQTNLRPEKSQPNQNKMPFECTNDMQSKKNNVDFQCEPNTSGFVPENQPIVNYSVVSASYHQGNPVFGQSAGRQCVAMTLSSMIHSNIRDTSDWTRNDLNSIMIKGNELYNSLQKFASIQNAYLNIEELPENVEIDGSIYHLILSPSLFGLLSSETDNEVGTAMSLQNALRSSFEHHFYAFVTFCETTFAVMYSDGNYHVFDSHSRNQAGEIAIDGTCIVANYRTLDQVYSHCLRLAASLHSRVDTQFEITPVSITSVPSQVSVLQGEPSIVNADTSQTMSFECDNMDCNSPKSKKRCNSRKKAQEKKIAMRKLRASKRPTEYSDNHTNQPETKHNRYSVDANYRESVNQASKQKYASDANHREAVKSASVNKYASDANHREAVKSASVNKYASDANHREAVKSASVNKYASDANHREAVKSASVKKYATNSQFRETLISTRMEKYAQNPQQVKNSVTKQRFYKRQQQENMKHVTEAFRSSVKEGPDYVCSVCHRKLFRKQVKNCKKEFYTEKNDNAATAAEKCITETYLHSCNDDCQESCVLATESSSKLWICHSCHDKVSRGKIPGESVVNHLQFQQIPPELSNLNELEEHLVSLNIPFMKVVPLPKGAQNSCHGPVVSVPSNLSQSVNALPRSDSEDRLVQVKLKRKLSYKGHYKNQYVNKSNVLKALEYLHTHNKYYRNVRLNNSWVNPLPVIDEEHEIISTDVECNENNENESGDNQDEIEDNVDVTREQTDSHGMLLDTCLQPIDIGQEILDQHFDEIISIAPGEGNSPIKILQTKDDEAKSFPCLFPQGGPIYHDNREEKLTLSRYLHCRLMNADTRCAKSIPYIFHSQYRTELEQVISKASIALRKGTSNHSQRNINAETLTDNASLQNFLKNDEGYRFLTPIRGTPPYWASTQKDLFAMIRQLGIPTWFCSFSSAETRWPEIIESILKESGDCRKADELDWNEKCTVLRQNPVTTARMFDQRFHTFLKDVIMSPAQPIGKVIDYFFRVEFQQRGSPHVHCLFWIDEAPIIDTQSDDEVIDFVNQYISCHMPDEENDPELNEIVTKVQRHSKRHSKTCKKNGKECRFNFPRPPSAQTFVSRPHSQTVVEAPSGDVDNMTDDERRAFEAEFNEVIRQNNQIMNKEQAKEVLGKIWQVIQNENLHFDSVEDLFTHIGISQDTYETASQTLTKKTSVVHRRKPSDSWINQYNPDLLRCWNANMDIQFVVDAFACVVYIVSYISKAEKEMGLLLERAQTEIRRDGNVDAKNAMKKIGSKYLNSREVSAQEAIFRVCTLDLKGCSRKVEFIPTVNRVKMSMPLKKLREKIAQGQLDEDDVWLPGVLDKYRARPETNQFEDMCQATFVSEYRVLSTSEVSKVADEKRRTPVFALLNNLGHIKKRINTDPAVVRYVRFSKEKDAEKYYQSSIELFLPHRRESQLLPPQFPTHELFYNDGAIATGSGQVETVRTIVERNRLVFEKNASEMQLAQDILESSGNLEDAWSQICPQAEVDRLECEDLRNNDQPEDLNETNDEQNIPDLLPHEEHVSRTEALQTNVSKEEAMTILKSLNEKQIQVFYNLRQWCLDKRNGKDPAPFHVFLTGGAGTGKSHLVKAIYYEATRLLAPTLENPDDTSVMLMAPTANAAFNIKGSTIHSALSIGIAVPNQYQYLCEDTLNTLRSKCGGVQILIIDEISMVHQKLLAYVHGRLKQIKQKDLPFGNVSILAVGDFYQLPPVKGTPLYKPVHGYDLWNDNFSVVELVEIMRQRNPEFATLLNRLRKTPKVNGKDDEINVESDDVALLASRVTGENPDCLHILSKNDDVDKYNQEMLEKSCPNMFEIDVEEFGKNVRTGEFELISKTPQKIGLDARVLLTQNIDTSDGLVNGAFGKVSHIATENEKVTTVYVVFDNNNVGKKLRAKKQIPRGIPVNSTPICRHDEKSSYSKKLKRKFPLKLAWACTIHKVQGLTVDQAVVSLKNIFAPGQAYVALSRVTSLEGLVLTDFEPKNIFCSSDVSEAVSNMPKYCQSVPRDIHNDKCHIVLHNVEGLPCHIDDLRNDQRFLAADFIFVTETWLSDIHNPPLDGFRFRHKLRSQAYDESNPLFATLKSQSHGGVGVFFKNQCEFPQQQTSNLEYLTVIIPQLTTSVTVVYRPQTYKVSLFKKQLKALVDEISIHSDKTIILGDFNENALTNSSIERFMQVQGFTQIASCSTTEAGTLPDHVYVRGFDNTDVVVMPTYFSFHDALNIFL